MKRVLLTVFAVVAVHGLLRAGDVPLAVAISLTGEAEAVEISAPLKTTDIAFYAVGEGGAMLDGRVLQTAGGLAIPVPDALVNCDTVTADPQVSLWKVRVHLPDADKPSTYAVYLGESRDGRTFFRKIVLFHLKEPAAAANATHNQ